MMAEDNPLVRRFEIVAVAESLGGGGALVVERHHARGDEFRVETEPYRIAARRSEHQPDAVDVLSAVQRDTAQTEGCRDGGRGPDETAQDLHALSLLKPVQVPQHGE